jgi:hypothetical protein
VVVRFRDSREVVPEVESAMFPRGASPVGEAFLVEEESPVEAESPVEEEFPLAAAFLPVEDRFPHGNRPLPSDW